jgi:acyl-ACP thioesterase
MHDIYIKEVVTGNELPLPGRLRKTAAASVSDFTVPYSYVDLNGHMNNARYYELAMDRMPEAFRVRSLRELTSEHIGEAQLGDVLTVGCSSSEDSFSIYGEKDKPVFRMRFQFE